MQTFLKENIKHIPSCPGVYIFHGESMPLYVGKSVNLHNRILNHINPKNDKSLRFVSQTKEIEIIPTAGNIGAEIRESRLIKTLSPIFNRQLRRERSLIKVSLLINDKGFLTPKIGEDLKIFDYSKLRESYIFRSKRDLLNFLENLSRKKGFCSKILGLEKGKESSPCFSYQLGKCEGACVGKVKPEEYNSKLEKEFGKFYVHKWPFSSNVEIEERFMDMEETFTVKNWLIQKINSKNIEFQIKAEPKTSVDEYKILARHFLEV